MKTKHLYPIAALVLTAAFILGFAVTLADASAGEMSREDRLVGVLVTATHLDLFDAEAYFADHAQQLMNGGLIAGDTSAYEGRLYARPVEESYTDESGQAHTSKRYTFEGVCEGIAYFYTVAEGEHGSVTAAYGDEAISEGNSLFAHLEEGESVELEGVLYVLPTHALATRYFNPVYQASDGSIYAVGGSGMSTDGFSSEDSAYAQTLSATYTSSENGVAKADSVSVKISVRTMFEPVRIRIAQFGAGNELLFADEYAPGTLTESIRPDPGAQYLIVETFKKDIEGNETVSRALYVKENTALDAFYARADGVCVKQSVPLAWEN